MKSETRAVTLQETPSANRIHIGFFGKRNSGKSSLLNAFAGQRVSIVSDQAGTTTDPVSKPMEIHGLGPCILMDTAGFDDEGILGQQRVEKTRQAAEKTEIALLLCGEGDLAAEKHWYQFFRGRQTPVIVTVSKGDDREKAQALADRVKEELGEQALIVSARERSGLDELRERLLRALPEAWEPADITGTLVSEGDMVLLVMPQDIQAPAGRLILPQVQTIRELLDKKCMTVCVTADHLAKALQALKEPPALIITDSQVFPAVYRQKPKDSLLTSFSVLFAAYKGDVEYYIQSARQLGALREDSSVLIAECCTHAPLAEDIGRVKLPRMLRERCGSGRRVDMVSGMDFPDDLTGYDLIIQCGGCMFNRRYILSRTERARSQGVPMTNYGVALAWLGGILDQVAVRGKT